MLPDPARCRTLGIGDATIIGQVIELRTQTSINDKICTFNDTPLFLLACAVTLLEPVLSFSESVKSRTLARTLRIEDLSNVVEDK